MFNSMCQITYIVALAWFNNNLNCCDTCFIDCVKKQAKEKKNICEHCRHVKKHKKYKHIVYIWEKPTIA